MAERISVEKTITEDMLDSGEIPLGPVEQQRLGIPDRSTALTLIADGDELPVAWSGGRRRLTGEPLLEYLQDTGRIGGLVRLEARDGGQLELVVLADRGAAFSTRSLLGASPAVPPQRTQAPAKRTRRANRSGRYRLRQRDEYAWEGGIGFLKEARAHLVNALKTGGWDPAEAVEVRLEGERLATLDQFEELLAVDVAKIEHMPHQEAAARTVLARMNGRGILADEVGLGKTVEGGLVIKELLLRGLAERVLIICPAPLRDQWREELRDKFGEDFVVLGSGQDRAAFTQDRLIMTHQLAMRNADRMDKPFDLVIIDEAHRLAGAGARVTREKLGRLVAEAPRALFLTATPVQNNLLELYRLVELLRPRTFRSERDFIKQFVNRSDPRRPVNAPELRKLVSSVVIRTTRQQAGLDKVRRMPPLDMAVKLSAPERQLYDLLVDALRHKMTQPGDAMRRRQLALRLTASPRAVMKSALRIAGTHPDSEVKRVMSEIGHLAGDIHHTAREQAALQVLHKWLDEHGRVLMFTQHTDTLDGLLRLLAAEGIPAAPFHGAMAHAAKGRSVADFRAGTAKVLVSTDAGAEGINLQVANCVLNYDLPWNPMRIEQRIGRVHRLTQTRDVYIANLFARDTVDEAVYRLLHDKLAMFELLFGQVVTVLGELDGTQDASMENRVLEALYAKSDATMQQRLNELGSQLVQARSRALDMMQVDNGLNDWIAQRNQERQERAQQEEARELLPDPAKRARRRQQDVEQFVRRFLKLAGAEETYSADGFVIVRLPADLTEALDGRDELYLAFTNAALEHHPEAELCVVGSEVFDELLRVLRERGDLTGSVRTLPAVHSDPVTPHAAMVRLAGRRIEPTEDWSARATYRVQDSSSSGTQEIVTIQVGPWVSEGRERESLADGAGLPAGLTAVDVLQEVDRRTVADLEVQLEASRKVEQQREDEARERLVEDYRRQVAEVDHLLEYSESAAHPVLRKRREQLTRAIEQARQSVAVGGNIEIRAELLAVEFQGSDELRVVERWEHVNGAVREIRYPWTGDLADHKPECEATGVAIGTFALCADGHAVDVSALDRCGICDQDWCDACGPDRAVATCPGCGRSACRGCRPHGGLCVECLAPERAPELDTTWERGWRLGGRSRLLVGARHAVLLKEDGSRVDVVPDADLDDPVRGKLRGLAARLRLPVGVGLTTAARPSTAGLTEGAAWADVDESVWWTWQPDSDGTIDAGVAALLPDVSGPEMAGESGMGIASLLALLRSGGEVPPAPAVAAMPFTVAHRVDWTDGQFVYRELWRSGDSEPEEATRDSRPLAPSTHETLPFCRPVAQAKVGPVTVEVDRLHRSYIALLTDGSRTATSFIPGAPAATVDAEEQLARMIADAGLPADRVAVRHPRAGATTEYGAAAPGTQVSRTATTVWAPLKADVGDPMTAPVDGPVRSKEFVNLPVWEDDSLLGALRDLAGPTVPVSVSPCLRVDESWRSRHGRAQRTYLVAPAEPVVADLLAGRSLVSPDEPVIGRLDDGGPIESLVGVDRRGHLYAPERTVDCPVCTETYCVACGDVGKIEGCRTCGRPACGECRSDTKPMRSLETCERCGDTSCHDCRRYVSVVACALCARKVCPGCADGTVCRTCSALAPATAEDLAGLPADLRADGLAVAVGHDDGGTVALLVGAHRTELAVFSGSQLDRWVTVRDEPPEVFRVRLAAARLGGSGDVDLKILDVPPPLGDADGLVLERHTSQELLWAVESGGERRAGSTRPPVGSLDRRKPVARDVVGQLVRTLTEDAPVERVPRPVSGERARVISRRAREMGSATGTAAVTACFQHIVDSLVIDGRGIVRRTVVGHETREEVASWETPEHTPEWAIAGWLPGPDVLATASSGAWTAVLAAVGGHGLLGVCQEGQQPRWSSVTEGTDPDLVRAALGHALLGRPALLSIGRGTRPGDVRGPQIAGAALRDRRASPYLVEEDGAKTDTAAAMERATLADYWPGMRPQAPEGRSDLPPSLVAALRERISGRPTERLTRDIGLHIREQWQLPAGDIATVEYRVPPGESAGYLTDAATGEPLSVAQLCRSHHVATRLDKCASCDEPTCAACPDKVRRCALCARTVCGRCIATADGRCAACSTFRKLGMMERRRLKVPWGATVWQGGDTQTVVTVERVKGVWRLERASEHGVVEFPLEGKRLELFQQIVGESAG
ncbi:DEAD/DEAH box helicase family protein [Planosporangium flavigriseum]|uniref:Helicase n=1 Tax=Planosporangium flavigriseum TaxID=373681 RepID=A0A8J3LZK1_9ACTN|nr:helicase-related protein [Planosporangium flavigriseum]NJC66984.1 DEAD/DEAH box helicase family protein [Planosporangium flavigriseum]GIG73950.1 hypothetical protein Pfl04_23540 [Planosporangium flavigriseum]